MAEGRLTSLIQQFRRHATFCASYSPLYQILCEGMAQYLEQEPNGTITTWLLHHAAHRTELETTLLLLAGIHRDVLLFAPGTEELRSYYPSAGGTKAAYDYKDQCFQAFFTTLQQRIADDDDRTNKDDSLQQFIRNRTVQTNETARGIFWLLPVLLTSWPRIHLVDLGCSAGLNLLADRRRYTMLTAHPDANDKSRSGDPDCCTDDGIALSFGLALKEQFRTCSEPHNPPFLVRANLSSIPCILSRTGCDLNPFILNSSMDETVLCSYVFGDQVDRLERLREGLDARKHVVEALKQPIVLHKVNLPDELPHFLRSIDFSMGGGDVIQEETTAAAPVVIYNTLMKLYLRNHGKDLEQHIADWAHETGRTVLWLQAEVLNNDEHVPQQEQPPPLLDHEYWCAWTAHLWEPASVPPSMLEDGAVRTDASLERGTQCHQWLLGWVHPHATRVQWIESNVEDLIRYFHRDQV